MCFLQPPPDTPKCTKRKCVVFGKKERKQTTVLNQQIFIQLGCGYKSPARSAVLATYEVEESIDIVPFFIDEEIDSWKWENKRSPYVPDGYSSRT